MKVLVAGSEGSLMQATIPFLLERGMQVVGVDNFSRYGQIERHRAYEFIEADLCDRRVVRHLLRGVDYVLQGAATIYGVVGFHKYPADILSRDLALHQNILWESLDSGTRKIIYISSSMVYERATRVPSIEEDVDDMPVPGTDYGLSKVVGERLCRAFFSQYGLKFTIWRPFNIITPFEKAEPEPGIAHVFADFVRRIVVERQNPMQILGDGNQVRCFTWIGDVASAIARFSFSEDTNCQIFNLGNPEPVTMRELAQRIHRMAVGSGVIEDGRPLAFVHASAMEDDVRTRVPSIEKAMRKLGWQPTVPLEEALRRCVHEAAAVYRSG